MKPSVTNDPIRITAARLIVHRAHLFGRPIDPAIQAIADSEPVESWGQATAPSPSSPGKHTTDR